MGKLKGSFTFAFFVLALALPALFFSYHLVFAQRVIPGVKLGERVYLGGKTEKETTAVLLEKFRWVDSSPFLLVLEGNEASPSAREISFALEPESFGFFYSATASAQRAYRIGRSGNFLADLSAEIKAGAGNIIVEPVYSLEERQLELRLDKLLGPLERPVKDAGFSSKQKKLELLPAQTGVAVEREKLKDDLYRAFAFLERRVTFKLKSIEPSVVASDLKPWLDRVGEVLAKRPKLVFGDRNWSLNEETVLSFLEFKKTGEGEVEMSINREVVNEYLAGLATEIDRPFRGQVIEVAGQRAVKFIPPQNGLELDRFGAVNLISQAVSDLTREREIALPVKIVKPPPSGTPDYGIRELLGEGVTDFSGSILGRINNIKLASLRLNGLMVPSGKVFSFNQSLGEVGAKTGYDLAYIIAQGRTVLGEGGGVCQVSTTLFRAALAAGLPIIKRTAHAYRVHYYEPPVGLDATVYNPAVDFQFKNDTSEFILIQADVVGTKLYFRLYGTADGRTVEISAPFISGETPPPSPVYQEDPSLPRGTKKQVDWAAWGANVVVTRVVKKGNTTLQDDIFRSRYRPWQAVYLLGTRD